MKSFSCSAHHLQRVAPCSDYLFNLFVARTKHSVLFEEARKKRRKMSGKIWPGIFFNDYMQFFLVSFGHYMQVLLDKSKEGNDKSELKM